MRRFLAAVTMLAPLGLALAGCGPNYSPDTYANNAAQQAAKVESGVVVGVRPVRISAQGAVGGVAGAAAGGVAGSQVGAGPTSAFGAIGGSLIGGLAGVASEHIVGDADGFEYIVRKANGDLTSVAQKDKKPLWVGEKVLVIAGPQARIVPDYTVPFEAPAKTAAKSPPEAKPAASGETDGKPAAGDANPPAHPPAAEAHPAAAQPLPSLPPSTTVPPQLPTAFGTPAATPPAIIVPPDVALPAPLGSAVPKP